MKEFHQSFKLCVFVLLALIATLQVKAQTGYPLIDEDFSGWTSASTIPQGWHTRIVDGIPGDYYWKYSPDGRDGNACACGVFTSNYKSGMLISKMINPASDQILRFWMQVDNINSNPLLVCTSSDSLGLNVVDTLAYLMPSLPNKWQFFEISLKGKTNTPFCIVFCANTTSLTSTYYIDNVLVENYPGCKPVEFGAPNNVTPTSVTLNWSYAVGDSYPATLDITVTDNNTSSVVFQDHNYDGINTSLNLTGLTSDHSYTVIAVGDCSSSQKGTSKSSQMTFKTRIPQISLPLNENFDSQSSLPSGWESSFENSTGVYINNSSSDSHSGNSSLVLSTERSGFSSIAFTPEINHASNDIQIDFWAKGTPGSTLSVGLIYDSEDLTENVSVYTFNSSGWQNIRFNTSNLSYFGVKTGFRVYFLQESGSTDYTTFIDDISIIPIPTCVRPEALSAYHTTCTNTMLRWQDITPASSYQVKVSRSGFSDSIYTVTTNPCTISGLIASANYSVAVRTICSVTDTSEWSLPVEVNTPCPAITGTWTEDFEESNGIPSCWYWKQIGGTYGTVNHYVRNTYQATYSYGGVGNHFEATTIGGNQDYLLITKPINVQNAGSIDIFFHLYRMATATSTQVTKVWANNYPDTIGAVLLKSISNYYVNEPAEVTEGLYEYWANIPLSGEVYIMFEFSGVGTMYLDHIHTEAKPACRPINHLRFDPSVATDNSVTLKWNDDENNQWIVKYSLRKDSEVHSDSLLVSGTPELTISGLNANTPYYASASVISYCSSENIAEEVAIQGVYARSGCAVPAVLPWNEDFETFTTEQLGDGTFSILPASFTSANTPYGSSMINTTATYLPEGSTKNLKMGNSKTNPVFLIFPEFEGQDDGVRLTFTYRNYTISNSDSLRYGYLLGLDTTTFVSLGALKMTSTLTNKAIVIDSLPVGSRLAFRYGGTFNSNTYAVYIDNISITEKPTCPILDNPSANTVGATTATIYAGEAMTNQWEVAYGVKDTPIEQMNTAVSTVGSSYINLSGLIPDTEYDMYARQICNTSNIGPWGAKKTFRTECTPLELVADVIYYDDFVWSNIDVAIGNCYAQDKSTGSYYWRRSDNRSYDNDGFCIRTTGNASNGIPGLYRQYHLEVGHTYEIGAACYGYSEKYTVDCVFAYGLLPSRDTMTVIGRITDVPYNGWKYGKYFFTPDSTADYYLGFYGESSYKSSVSMYLDTLTVREVSCIPPVINAVIPAASSASISYINFNASTELVVATDPEMTNVIFSAVQPATLNLFNVAGLNSSSRYYYRLRLVCGSDEYSEWTEVDYFDTYCDAKPIPYTEGFESEASMICWNSNGDGEMERTVTSKHNGSASMMLNNIAVYSPEFQVASLTNCELNGYVMASTAGASLSIGVSTDIMSAEGYEQISGITISQANVWQPFTVYFDDLNEPEFVDFRDAKILAFVSNSGSNIYLDDIELHTAPSCRRPLDLAASNITDSCVTLSWTSAGSETSWVVDIYGRRDTVTTNPCTIKRLISDNDYEVRIAALCDDGEMSEFSSSVYFSTPSPSVAATPWIETFEDFANQAALANGRFTLEPMHVSGTTTYPYFSLNSTASKRFDEGGNKNLLLVPGKTDSCFFVLPVMDAPISQLVLSFLYANGGTSTLFPQIVVGLMTDPTDHSTFREMRLMSRVTIANAKSSPASVVNFSENVIPAGYENAHIVFVATPGKLASASYCAYLDNVSVIKNSSCANPFNIRTNNLLSTSTDICFSDTANTQWQYVLAHRGESNEGLTPSTTTDTVISLTGLVPATNYILYLRSYCSAASQSPWNTINFITSEAPVQLPYISGFEDGGDEWKNVQCTDDNFFVVGSDPSAVCTGNHALYVTDDGVANHQGIHYGTSYTYLPVELNASKYEINFDWLATGGYSTTVFGRAFLAPSSMQLATSSTSSAPSGLTASALPSGAIALDGGTKMNLIDQWQHASNIVDLTNAPGSYKLVFYWRSTTSSKTEQSPLAIDNVYFKEITCPMVEGFISVDSLLTDTTLAFHFTKTSGTLSEYRISLTGNVDDYIIADTTMGNMVTLTGLSASQLYTVFVRNVCSEQDASPWVSDTIRTSCGVVTMLPLIDHYESPVTPCWTRTNLTPTSIISNWSATYNPSIIYRGNCLKLLGSVGSTALNASPLIHFDGNTDYHVTFYMYTYKDASYNDKLSFYLSNDPASLDMAEKFYECTSYNADYTGNEGFVRYDVDIPAGTDGNYYFIMRGDYNKNGNLYIDDLTIDAYPSCRELTNLPEVDFAGDNFMNIRITDHHPMWQYAWAQEDGGLSDTIASIVTDIDKVTINGLTPGTQYSFYARAFCNNGDTTGWVPFGTYRTKTNSCFAPSRIQFASTVCDTMATFSWLHGSEANTFSYVLRNTATNDSVTGVTTTDTLTIGGLTENTQYRLDVYTHCDEDSYGSSFEFTTSYLPAAVPYVSGFEDENDNSRWIMTNAKTNKLIIGSNASAVHSDNHALYVSSNPMSEAYSYSNTVAGLSFAYRVLDLPAGMYSVQYDWKCRGEVSADYGRVFLLPADIRLTESNSTKITLPGFSASSLPVEAIALDNGSEMNNSLEWNSYSSQINVAVPGRYNLVVAWRNDAVDGFQPPMSIDNISLVHIDCEPLNAIIVTPADIFADAVFARRDSESDFEYGVSMYNNPDSIMALTLVPTNGELLDTLRLTGLNANTQYYLFARSSCAEGAKSTWIVKPFTTTADVASMPYITGFETSDDCDWQYIQAGQTNQWVIGQAESMEGQRSLYISYNNGVTRGYDVSSPSVSFATRNFYLTPGLYEVSYDWKGYGEASADYMRVVMLPVDVPLSAGTIPSGLSATTTPMNSIALDGGTKLNLSSVWQTRNNTFAVTEYGVRKLVVMWRNDGANGINPSACIDNLVVRPVSCGMVSGVNVTDITGNSVSLTFINNNEEATDYVYAYGTSADRTMAIYDTTSVPTVQISGLEASTRYNLWVRTICSDTAMSSWYKASFQTECQVIDNYPFIEDFESTNGFPVVCWQSVTVTSGNTYNGNWDLYQDAVSTEHISSGSHSMVLTAGGGTTGNNIIALPEMDFQSGHRYSLSFSMYRSASSLNNNKLNLWIGTTATDTSTSLGSYVSYMGSLPAVATPGMYDYSVDLPDTIAGIRRIIFQGLQTYSSTTETEIYVDDIRVNEWVEAPAFSDTICGTLQDYSGYGFNIAYRDIQPGLNVLTRRAIATDAPDTFYTLNLYSYAPVIVNLSDTICNGEVYNNGYFQNLTQAGAYQSSGLVAHTGCDSTVILQLYVVDIEYHRYDTICQGDSIMFNDTWYKTSGTYSFDTLNSRGCAETSFMHLVVEQTLVLHYDTVCEGTSVMFHNQTYNATGTYDYNYLTASGCAAVDRLNLVVVEANPQIYDTICQGQTYYYNGQSITESGTYQRSYVSPAGCDVTEDLHLTVTPPETAVVNDVVCQGYPYYGNGIIGLYVTQDTVVTVTSHNWNLCDSITEVHLHVIPTLTSEFSITITEGEVYRWNNNDYTQTGDYTDTFVSEEGCDSVVTLHLTVGSGVNNVSDVNIDIVPNPINVNAETYLYGNYEDVVLVEIVDNFGHVIDSFVPQTYPIQISGIRTAGVYYLRITTNTGSVYVRKLIVQ